MSGKRKSVPQLDAAREVTNQTGGDRGEGPSNFVGVSQAVTNDSLQDRDGIDGVTGGSSDLKDAYFERERLAGHEEGWGRAKGQAGTLSGISAKAVGARSDKI